MELTKRKAAHQLESRDLLRLVAEAALDRHAQDIVILETQSLTSVADYFVVMHGTSDRQLRSIADAIHMTLKEIGIRPLHVEGLDSPRWVLLDYGDVVIHVFHKDVRPFYHLEKLWAEAPEIELSELGLTQTPPR